MFKAYTEAFMRKNLWRLARTCEFDDAMQEGYIVFLECRLRYCSRVDNAAWFMALYKKALHCRVTDLAATDTRHKGAVLMCDAVDEDAAPPEAVGETANAGELHTMLRQAPDEVRSVLALLINAPLEILDLVTSTWKAHGNGEVYGSKMLCRLLGFPEDANLLQRVRAYWED